MADQHRERLDSFRAFIQATEQGIPVPPVSYEHLKHLHKIQLYLAKWHPGSDGAVSMDLMVSVCGSEADLPAVWLRHTRLRLLFRQGVLAQWQNGADLEDVVYQVAAQIPINGFQLDQDEFIQRLSYEYAA
jgi:hypothetical protein